MRWWVPGVLRIVRLVFIVLLWHAMTKWWGTDPVLAALILIISEMWWLADD